MLTTTRVHNAKKPASQVFAALLIILLVALTSVFIISSKATAAPDASTFDPISGTTVPSDHTYQSYDNGYGNFLDFRGTTPTIGPDGTAMITDAIELGEWDPRYSGSVQGFTIYQRWGNAKLGSGAAEAVGDTFYNPDQTDPGAPIPMAGVRVYAQYSKTCGTHAGFVSQVYTAVSEQYGFYKINIADEVTPKGVVGFGADPTVSNGCEKWRIWAENPDQNMFRTLVSPAYGMWFPKSNVSDTTYASQSLSVAGNVGGDDALYRTRIAFSDRIDNRAMHLTNDDGSIHTLNEPSTLWYASDGGYVGGSVGWNYDYSQGALTWGPQTLLAYDTTDDAPAPGLKVYGSYLSDYAVCMVESHGLEFLKQPRDYGNGIETYDGSVLRGGGWNNFWEARIQNWIKVQIKAAKWAAANGKTPQEYVPEPHEAPYTVAGANTNNALRMAAADTEAAAAAAEALATNDTNTPVDATDTTDTVTPAESSEVTEATQAAEATDGVAESTDAPAAADTDTAAAANAVTAATEPCDAFRGFPVNEDGTKGDFYTGQQLWIAETKGAIVRDDGTYSIYFNGIYGSYHNSEGPSVGGLHHGLAPSPTTGKFPNVVGGDYTRYQKHVNGDWLFVSLEDVHGTAVATPMMANWYGAMRYLSAIGNTGSAGWVGSDWDGPGDATKRIDFSMFPGNYLFDAVPYNSTDNYAVASDRITTRTLGLPTNNLDDDGPSFNTNDYLIIWRDDTGKQVKTCGPMRADKKGALEECPFVVPEDLDRITTYTASLHVLSGGTVTEKALASDSFTAVPVYLKWMSKYDDYTAASGYNIWPKGMGAPSSNAATPIHNRTTTVDGQPIDMSQPTAEIIPGVTLNTATGELTGRPTATGRWKVHVSFERWFNEGGDAFKDRTECVIKDGCYSSTVEYDVYLVVTDNPLPDAHKGTYYEYDVASLYKDDVAEYLNNQQLSGLGIPNGLIGFQGSGTPGCDPSDPNRNCTRQTDGKKIATDTGYTFEPGNEVTGYWKLQQINKVTLDQVLLDRGLRANGSVISGVPKDPTATVSGEYAANEVAGTADTKEAQPNAAHDRTNESAWATNGPNVRIEYTAYLVDKDGNPVLDNDGKQITRTHSDYVPLSILGEGAVAKIMGGTKILNEEPVPGITPPYATISGGTYLVPSAPTPRCNDQQLPQWATDVNMPAYKDQELLIPQACPNASTDGYFVRVITNNATAEIRPDGQISVKPTEFLSSKTITLEVFAPGSAIPQSDNQFQFTLTPGVDGYTSFAVKEDAVGYDPAENGFDYEGYFSQDESDLDQQGYNSPGEPQAVASWNNGTGTMTVTTSLKELMAGQTTADDATRAFFKFPDLTFTRAGVYFFTIKEENLGEDLVTYNQQEHKVAVIVTGDNDTGYHFVRILDIATWEKLMAPNKIGDRRGCVNGSGSPELSSVNDDSGFYLDDISKFNAENLKRWRSTYWITTDKTETVTNWDKQFDTAFSATMSKCLSNTESVNGQNVDKYPAINIQHMNFKDATQGQAELGGTKFLFDRSVKDEGTEETAEKLPQELNQFTFTITEGAEGYTSFAVKSASIGYAFAGDPEFTEGFNASEYFNMTDTQLAAAGFNGAGQPEAIADGTSMTVKTYLADDTGKTGLFDFPKMNFNRAGVYYFTIQETKCPGVQLSGVYTCDETKYPVAVVVTGADYVGYGYNVVSVLDPTKLANITTTGSGETCSALTTDTRDAEITEFAIANPTGFGGLRLSATMAKTNPAISMNGGANFDVAFTEAVNGCVREKFTAAGSATPQIDQIQLTVNNYRFNILTPGLPFTGGWHYHWFFLGGSIALALVAAYLLINRKNFFTVAAASGTQNGKHRK